MNLKPQQSALLGAIAVAMVAQLVPLAQATLLPVAYLNTHFHEFCHAIVALATGGSVEHILVFSNGGGVTPVAGGILPFVASAGYMGSTVIGACVVRFSATPERARTTMGVLAAILALSLVFFVRGDSVGVASGIFWVAVLLAGARFLRGTTALFIGQFIGVELCLSSVSSVYQLLQISFAGEAQSDALLMQNSTLIPASIWAAGWCGFSLFALGFTVRSVWKSGSKSRLSA